MKTSFPDLVEKGRHTTHGPYATTHGLPYGVFRLRHPHTRELLAVVANAGDPAAPDGTPEWWDHVSVSADNRTPTWEEMCWVKDLFFDPEECVMQLHPPRSDYVNHHPHTLHLWRPARGGIPRPPREAV